MNFQNRPTFLLPWLIYVVLMLIVDGFIVAFTIYAQLYFGFFFLFFLLIYTYFLFVIRRLFKEMLRGLVPTNIFKA